MIHFVVVVAAKVVKLSIEGNNNLTAWRYCINVTLRFITIINQQMEQHKMTTALAIVAANTGASEEDISEVITGMIISSKNQHGAIATKAEVAVFTGVCSRYALNPLVKECAAFVSGGKLQVIVMVDGWYKMVNRQENFDGVEFEDNLDKDSKVVSITCKMYVKNRSRPVCVTEYLSECKDPKSSVWTRWPARMLRHKAYIQAARIAFGISEVIDDDEVNRIKSNSNGYNTQVERDITPQQEGLSNSDIEEVMAECADLETLKSACSELRADMQKNGTWASKSAVVISLNVKHKERINSYVVEETPDPYFDSYIEEAEETTTVVEEEDIGFGDDKDEFGEKV
jgi:hypothetical protein